MSEVFPEPFAPILPVLSSGGWARSVERSASVFLSSDCIFLHGARYALLSGLQAMNVGRGEHVLLPAYHCYSIVEPFMLRGCQVEFYKLNPDLSINIADLVSRLRDSTRAVLITHYFAMPQPVDQILDVLKDSSVLLIEDCAHAFFGQSLERKLGSFGAFSVASGKKFFPFEDGGILKFNLSPEHPVTLARNPQKHNLKLLVNALEKSAQYGRLRPLSDVVCFTINTFHLLNARSSVQSSSTDQTSDIGVQEEIYIDRNLISRYGSSWSRWFMLHTNLDRLQENRKSNFQCLLSGLSDLKLARPLLRVLPEHVVPYVFPLLLEKPEKHFPLLKKAAVPMWRWEDVQLSHCTVSKEYRDGLVQFPCHQGMKRSELIELIKRIRSVLCH